MRWTLADLPDQHGRVAVVTGANSGIGLETAAALAGGGAHVVMGCRNLEKAAAAEAAIRERHPRASLEVVPLDLSSQAATRRAAETIATAHDHVDLLICNAGVMALPRTVTEDGWEMQLATNHLGHFALAGLLIERLVTTPGSRITTVTSLMHKPGHIDFDDLQGERSYRPWAAYCQSKLANLLFARELDRRLRAAGSPTISTAAHPGYTATDLQAVGPRQTGARVSARVRQLGNWLIGQSPATGALPTLFAATSPTLRGGELAGPRGLLEMWGHPKIRTPSARGLDDAVGRRLWEVSESLTGVRYPGR